MLSSRYTDLADPSLCGNLAKRSKLLILLRPLNLTYYQPRLLVLNMKILHVIEIKLIFLCLIDIY